MKIKIKVTKEILQRAKFCGFDEETKQRLPHSIANIGSNCGIGIAVGDLLPNAWVSSNRIWIFDENPDWYLIQKVVSKIDINLPFEAIRFIIDFDRLSPEQRAAMQPISFDIEVPDAVIERIGIGQVYKILSESKTSEHVQ